MNEVPGQDSTHLRVMIGSHPEFAAVKEGRVSSGALDLEFADVKPIHRGFKPMVADLAFDASELAVVTFLQAKALGRPLVLLPVVLAARFQHGCIVYDARRGTIRPKDLAGRRVGVRSYTQTTGTWVRGILEEEYGADLDSVSWITFEGSHVTPYDEPPRVQRASEGKELLDMFLAGELDAAMFGNDMPREEWCQPVVPNPDEAARESFERNGIIPINHVLTVTEELADRRPDAVRRLYDLFVQSKDDYLRAHTPNPDLKPIGVDAIRPSMEKIMEYSVRQDILREKLDLERILDESRRLLE